MSDELGDAVMVGIAIRFGVPPLLAWAASVLVLLGAPTGTKTTLGIGAALVAALTTAYALYVFSMDGTIPLTFLGGFTCLLIVGHLRRFFSTRNAGAGALPSGRLGAWLRQLWRHL